MLNKFSVLRGLFRGVKRSQRILKIYEIEGVAPQANRYISRIKLTYTSKFFFQLSSYRAEFLKLFLIDSLGSQWGQII